MATLPALERESAWPVSDCSGPPVEELLGGTLDLWLDCPTSWPSLGRSFTTAEQQERESRLDRFLAVLQAELRGLPRTATRRQVVRDRLTSAFEAFARSSLDLDDGQLELLLDDGFSSVSGEMARQARQFDPSVSVDDILQATRNAWTAGGLQMLLGRPMCVTPAIFAYSMLYPYSDNYLDSPETSPESKLAFSTRFGRRLAGDPVAAANAREVLIWRLVETIENQYARPDWPQVFDGLLAIHRAQEDSIRLLRGGRACDAGEILELSLRKGGTSVLADGYLAAGALSRDEAQRAFDWGAMLQLGDDLQDVLQDRQEGSLTLFTQAAGRGTLDELTSRTFHFARRVMQRLEALPGAGCRPLMELIERSSWSLLLRSAGDAGQLYSGEYLRYLERHSPFRFAFLRSAWNKLERQRGSLTRLFEVFLGAY